MPTLNVNAISLFELGRDAFHRPRYARRRDWDFDLTMPVNDAIDFAKRQIPGLAGTAGPEADEAETRDDHAHDHDQPRDDHDHRGEDREHQADDRERPARLRGPERYLDIEESGTRGVCLYAFYLNVLYGGQQRLEFGQQGGPFIVFPLNSSSGEDPVQVQSYGTEPRFASFVVDAGGLWRSRLADRIRQSPHSDELRIAFYFNVVDPVPGIAVAPWAHSDRSHQHPNPVAGSPYFTHGGVHPEPAARFIVNL